MSPTIDQAILHAMVASRFARVMGEWLTPDQMAEVRRRNASPRYEGCCATHDFCDANMAMLEAFEGVMGREPALGEDDDSALAAQERDLTIMNVAWDIAKRDHFTGTPQPDSENRDGATPGASSVLADELDDQDPDVVEAFERSGPRSRGGSYS